MHPGPRSDEGDESVRNVSDSDGGAATEHAAVDGSGPTGETIQMAGDGRNAGVTAADGQIHYRITGTHPGTEPGELQAAMSLVEKLNQLGADWDTPSVVPANAKTERGVDCTSKSKSDPRTELDIQVTTPETRAWEELRHDPSLFERGTTVSDIVEALRQAIEGKRYRADPTTVLVLAAYDSPAHALRSVAEGFVDQHGAWAEAVGFKEVWVCGPTAALVHRLDRGPR
jgi:hypothetical protein